MTTIVDGQAGITFPDSSAQGTAGYTGFRNRIINGDMRIDQRNAGASVNPAVGGSYYLDRWQASSSQTGKFQIGQNLNSVTTPAGFVNYLGISSLSSYVVLAGDFFGILQSIEGFNISDWAWGTANAKTIVLSFQVYSSLTGTFGGALRNSGSTRSYPFTYTISAANTWTSVSITIAGDTAGTWLTTNGLGVSVYFGLGAGSTYSGTSGAWTAGNYVSAVGATSVVSVSGATFYITGVQLELGGVATPFERRNYGTELALCQRYYYQTTYNGANSTTVAAGVFNSTSGAAQIFATHPTTMRAAPTVGYVGVTLYDGTNNVAVNSISSQASSTIHMTINLGTASAVFAAGRAAMVLSASTAQYLTVTAEL